MFCRNECKYEGIEKHHQKLFAKPFYLKEDDIYEYEYTQNYVFQTQKAFIHCIALHSCIAIHSGKQVIYFIIYSLFIPGSLFSVHSNIIYISKMYDRFPISDITCYVTQIFCYKVVNVLSWVIPKLFAK